MAACGGIRSGNKPSRTRLKAAIQEAGNVSAAIGLTGQNASLDPDKFCGRCGRSSGTYGAFNAAHVHTRRASGASRNQDSKFRMAVLHILVAHSGPETAADGRRTSGSSRHKYGSCFRAVRSIHLNFWDYNDVAPAYFAAAEIAAREAKSGLSHWKLPGPISRWPTVASSRITDLRAPAKGFYVIRDFAPGKPRHGYVVTQGSSSTVNLVSTLPKLEEAGINVKVVAAISENYSIASRVISKVVLPPEAYYDLMVVSTGTRRVWPLRDVGPLTDEYSLTSDWDNQWLTGGLEAEVIAEAHLDPKSIFNGIQRFATEREKRISRQKNLLA